LREPILRITQETTDNQQDDDSKILSLDISIYLVQYTATCTLALYTFNTPFFQGRYVMPVTTCPTVSVQQYTALQTPVVLPTPEELFDFQVQTLKDKGLDLPDEDVDRLRSLIPNAPQLFLLIPPRPGTLDLNGLVALIEVDGKTGVNYLDLQHLTDTVETPATAHLLLDVEDGRERLNTKPSVSFDNIRQEGQLPYTTWYGLVHGIVFPYVLQDHYLNFCGSRYGSGYMPFLCLGGGIPGLYYFWDDDAAPWWGVPSAGSVVGA
jgi:hypothetical protein